MTDEQPTPHPAAATDQPANAGASPKPAHGHHAHHRHKRRRAHVAHHIPGRMRVKIAEGKNNPELLAKISQSLASLKGVQAVTPNPQTGSILLQYAPEAHEDIHDHVHGVFDEHVPEPPRPLGEIEHIADNLEREAEFLANHSHFARVVVDGAKMLDREVKLATGNAVDLKVVIPLGLAAVAFVEIGIHAATPVWVTLALFSLNHFVEMHAHDLDAVATTR
jgi:hypothetical protein